MTILRFRSNATQSPDFFDPPPFVFEIKQLVRLFTVMSRDAREVLIGTADGMAFPMNMTDAEQRAREALLVALEKADHVAPTLFAADRAPRGAKGGAE